MINNGSRRECDEALQLRTDAASLGLTHQDSVKTNINIYFWADRNSSGIQSSRELRRAPLASDTALHLQPANDRFTAAEWNRVCDDVSKLPLRRGKKKNEKKTCGIVRITTLRANATLGLLKKN